MKLKVFEKIIDHKCLKFFNKDKIIATCPHNMEIAFRVSDTEKLFCHCDICKEVFDKEPIKKKSRKLNGTVKMAKIPMSPEFMKFLQFICYNSKLSFDIPDLFYQVEQFKKDYLENIGEKLNLSDYPKGWAYEHAKNKPDAQESNKQTLRVEFKPTEDFTLDDIKMFLHDDKHTSTEGPNKNGWYKIPNSPVIWQLLTLGFRFDNQYDADKLSEELSKPLEDQITMI